MPPLPALTHLLYLHGFRSSPQSTKARKMAAWVAEHRPALTWLCPQLPASPRQAARLIDEATGSWPAATMAVMGSSLGGFYATWLAQRRGARAVLLNPAVDPARDLARHVGEQTSWHNSQERFYFEPQFVNELQALDAGPLSQPERLMAVVATGDEVLDWREMRARYAGCHLRIVQGSDHALSDFEQHLPAILDHLGLTA
ncbi:MAG: hypothetical protein RLZZ180_2583 [Pseudomonadota bacterium]|jgi:hypothetical protein